MISNVWWLPPRTCHGEKGFDFNGFCLFESLEGNFSQTLHDLSRPLISPSFSFTITITVPAHGPRKPVTRTHIVHRKMPVPCRIAHANYWGCSKEAKNRAKNLTQAVRV